MDAKIQANAMEIKHTGAARVLVAYLNEKLKAVQNGMVIAKDIDMLRQHQGRAQELTELIKTFSSEN